MRTKLILALVALTFLLVPSCSFGLSSGHSAGVVSRKGPPAHAPAHGYRRKHCYRYYPSCCVYFDIERKLYFYLEGGNWRVSARLPAGIRMDVGEAVVLSLETDRPYLHFQKHKTSYPPGQLKKRGRPPGKAVGQRRASGRPKDMDGAA
ncbi:MAG: hypothetical protein KAX19_12235 [Candidatus Brocadiae bacterium]|nr:hypothetical protein [Candidatus Brocadiia bacterium]